MFASISQHLLPGEQVFYRAKYHWLFNARSGLTLNMFNLVVVTNYRVLEKTGILATHVQSIPYSQVESIDVTQSVPGRVLGFGDVVVQGSGAAVLRLENVASPAFLMRQIGSAMRSSEETPPKPSRKSKGVAKGKRQGAIGR